MLCRQLILPIIMVITIVIIFVFGQVIGLLKKNIHIRKQYCAEKGVV